MPSLAELGPRICVFGPSNSGKSTLADAIGRRQGLPAVHLDLLRHLPDTDWVQRPDAEFAALHAKAIAAAAWVMDGNYSTLTPARLERATGVIVLEMGRAGCLYRYFRRTLFQHNRIGALAGGKDSVKWEMVHWIAWRSPHRRPAQRALLARYCLPRIDIAGWTALRHFYVEHGLQFP